MIFIMLSKVKKELFFIIAVLFALLFWQILSKIVDADFIVPPISKVIERMIFILGDRTFLGIAVFSISKIFMGSMIGIILGIILGISAGRFEIFRILFEPYFLVAKSVPVASFIIILLVWLSSSRLPIFISALITFSPIYLNTLTAFRQTDKKLLEMAKVFKLGLFRKIKFIYIPSIYPMFMSALTLALGNAWKAGIAAEIIGLPDGSIGNELYKAKIYFETADMFAWTFIIIILSFLFEKIFIFAIKLLLIKRSTSLEN